MDCGASASFITLSLAKQINLHIDSSGVVDVRIGNNKLIQTLGTSSISIKVGNKSRTINFNILEELPFPCILGLDFIYLFNIILDIPRGKFWFHQQPNRLFSLSNAEYLCALQGLEPSQKHQLQELLSQFPDVLCDKIGRTTLTECKLEVSPGPPIAQKPYRVSPTKQKIISEHIKQMLASGTIRPSMVSMGFPCESSTTGWLIQIHYRLPTSQYSPTWRPLLRSTHGINLW